MTEKYNLANQEVANKQKEVAEIKFKLSQLEEEF